MIVFSVTILVREAKISQARDLFGASTQASRAVPGVVSFDILQDPQDAGRFVSIEVYEDQAAVDRQGELPEVKAISAVSDELLTVGLRGTIYHVSSSELWPAA